MSGTQGKRIIFIPFAEDAGAYEGLLDAEEWNEHFAEKSKPKKTSKSSFLQITSDDDDDDLLDTDPFVSKTSPSVTSNSNKLNLFLNDDPVENNDVCRRYQIVCYDPNKITKLALSSDDDVIYIYGGHGQLGCTTIEAQDKSGTKYKLEASEVANRLKIQFGLEQSFHGKVKLYVCDGTAGSGLISQTFGFAFVQEFTKHCNKCKIYAYAAKVEKRHGWYDLSEGKTRKEGYITVEKGKLKDKVSKRAKSFRYEIYPSFRNI